MTLPAAGPMLGLLGLVLVSYGAACAHNLRASPETGVVRGSVAYRERMALPPDAVVEVKLSDVSRQDASAPVIAETTVRPEGRQVPLSFELRYDPKKIEPNRSYALRATIRSAGRMIFTTDTAYPVITQGNPTEVDLWLVRVSDRAEEATSGSAAAPSPSELWGTAWRLEDLGGAGVLDRVQATLEFPEAGRAAGSGSCNRFFGAVQISGESITFGSLGSTQMACTEAVGTQEGKYLKALRDAERFGLDGPALLIYSKGMDKPLRFIRTRP